MSITHSYPRNSNGVYRSSGIPITRRFDMETTDFFTSDQTITSGQ